MIEILIFVSVGCSRVLKFSFVFYNEVFAFCLLKLLIAKKS